MRADSVTWNKVLHVWKKTRDTEILEFLSCSQESNIIIFYTRIIMSQDLFITNSNEKIYSFHSIIEKHARNPKLLTVLLSNFWTLKPKQVSTVAALIDIITHVYSEKQLDKVMEQGRLILKSSLISKLESKITMRLREIQKQMDYLTNFDMKHLRNRTWSKKDSRVKPFGFCCSMDRFDPLSRYDQRIPPYESSLASITSVHECPVSKMQVKFFTTRPSREKRRLIKSKASDAGDQERSKNVVSNYSYIGKNDRSIKWYLEDEIALAKDILWAKKQKIYNEESDKAINIGRKKHRTEVSLGSKYPRWYQDFSPIQMENLMNLENALRIDYEETKTDATQTTLLAIGVISTFFKLKSNIIKELHKSCNLNSVNFLREIYRILTKNDFYEEGYKKFYDCNERIILSAIAFLTLTETVVELDKRLPTVIMPILLPKPKQIYVTRQKNSCPYKEELFKRFDWAGYRNALQEWQKQCKLFAVPRMILPLKEYGQLFINNGISSKTAKPRKDIYTECLKETSTRELQKASVTKYDQKAIMNIDEQIKYKDSSREKNLEEKKSTIFDTSRLPLASPQLPHDETKFNSAIKKLSEELKTTQYKICGPPKPLEANRKSWLGEKDAQYLIGGVTAENSSYCPVTYEITGVTNVTPSNSDERFFAVLKLGSGKMFPSGRENLSRNWQEWLRNADEDFREVEEKADELIKSVQTVMKLAFPKPVCDSCCPCRQTRKTNEKLQHDNIPIDSVVQNGEENKHIMASLTMQSSESNPTRSRINPTASRDEIKTNIIIDGVIKENGQTRYCISDVQEEIVRVISRVLDSPAPQPVRNVPPCACAIRQMANKDISPTTSKDDIPWRKDEGLCPGKKYRPDELGAYSCKAYPDDKSCRHNPFIKEIIKLQKREREKQEEEEGKGKPEFIEAVEEETVAPKKKVTERKKDKFIPDFDYPAYDDPWNISRTAPSPKIMETDYEKSLKLTIPALPAISSALRMQERQKDNPSSSKEVKKNKQDTLDDKNDEKIFNKTFLKSSKKVEEERNKTKKEVENTEKRKRKEQLFSKKIAVNKKSTKSLNKISKFMTADKTQKRQTKLSSSNRLVKRPSRVDRLFKQGLVKKDTKKSVVDEDEQLDSRKQAMAKLKNMFKSFAGVLCDIEPAVLPWELPAIRDSEEKTEDIVDSSAFADKEESRVKGGPYGWRTKSEQELPAKKTLVYLCEPDYPLETMPVRLGGRPCQCRENRSKKKVLAYNVAGVVEKKRNGRRPRKTKLEEENRIIDGVFYFTPPDSPRRSDEYVPEYELLESPYDTCISETTNERSKLIERYSGPKSLVEKIRKELKACNCSVTKKDRPIDQKENLEETRQKLMESKSPEERWKMALNDPALIDYFTQRKDNIPCWISCKKFARSARPRRLKIMKPVCECKYERKILERNEESAKWKARQKRLKIMKKQPFTHIAGISRPMVEDKKFIISEVKRIPRENEYKDDIKYCISGVTETITMSPPQQIIDGLKMSTPLQTPEPSKEDILRPAAPHRHWSPMNIPPGPLRKRDAALKEEMERRKKIRDEAFKLIYGHKIERDVSCPMYCNYQESRDEEKLVKKVDKNREMKESHTSVEKEISEATMKFQPPTKKASSKLGHEKDTLRKEITGEIVHVKGKYFEDNTSKVDYQQDISYKKIIDKTGEKIDEVKRINGDGDKKHTNNKLNLVTIIKAELEKMAAEGYTFAKLPECYLMPQLRDWIMHREGVVFSEKDKKNLMQTTAAAWKLKEMMRTPTIERPSLHMTKRQLKSLTYDRAEEIQEKIAKTRAIFYSKVRKARVSYARAMWNTMEFGKFPSASFKRAFFTYMPGKEADGHVYKPWLPSEVRKRDPEFSCC